MQIYKENKPFYYINTYDETKSNWMRYVSAPYSPQSQNLIACQCGVSLNHINIYLLIIIVVIVRSYVFVRVERKTKLFAMVDNKIYINNNF